MSERIRVRSTGCGYESIERIESGERSYLPHHRLLAYAWGDLSSPFFSADLREIHHRRPIPWLNTESNLSALTPEEHRAVDSTRGSIRTPWDKQRARAEGSR